MSLSGFMFVFGESRYRMFPLGTGLAFLARLLSPGNICSDSKDQVGINSLAQLLRASRLTSDYIPSV